jgi:hypothetical protein
MNLGILRVVGIVLFLYLTWRNLRDNYPSKDLISYSWEALLAFFVGGRVVYGLINWGIWNTNLGDWLLVWQKPGMNYEGAYLALIGVTVFICNKKSWKIWTFLEQILTSTLVLLLGVIGDEFVRARFEISLGLVSLLLIICLVVANIAKKKYRSFTWYKSGKSGFAWFFVNFVFWFLMMIISLLFWNNETRAFVYIFLSLTSLLGLFILGDVLEPLLIFGKRKKQYE